VRHYLATENSSDAVRMTRNLS